MSLSHAFGRVLLAVCSLLIAQSPSAQNCLDTQSFTVASDDNVVAGEVLTLCDSDPDTALIMVGGSGHTDREGTRPAAGLFASNTAALVILDRRGHGASTGRYERPSTQNSIWMVPAVAADVFDVAAHLKREGFSRVGVVGSSFGGWVAASAAAKGEAIDFLAGFVGGVVSVATSDAFDVLTDQQPELNLPMAVSQVKSMTLSESYDPLADLEGLSKPGLWVFGELDDSNPTQLDTERLDRLVASGKPFAYLVLPGANHDLVTVSTGEFDASWLETFRTFVAGKD